jgi:hypothetical protein
MPRKEVGSLVPVDGFVSFHLGKSFLDEAFQNEV